MVRKVTPVALPEVGQRHHIWNTEHLPGVPSPPPLFSWDAQETLCVALCVLLCWGGPISPQECAFQFCYGNPAETLCALKLCEKRHLLHKGMVYMSPFSQNEEYLSQGLKADSKVTYVCASSALKKQLGRGTHERLGLGIFPVVPWKPQHQGGSLAACSGPTLGRRQSSDLSSATCRLWAGDMVLHLSACLHVLSCKMGGLLPPSESCVNQRCAWKGPCA